MCGVVVSYLVCIVLCNVMCNKKIIIFLFVCVCLNSWREGLLVYKYLNVKIKVFECKNKSI